MKKLAMFGTLLVLSAACSSDPAPKSVGSFDVSDQRALENGWLVFRDGPLAFVPMTGVQTGLAVEYVSGDAANIQCFTGEDATTAFTLSASKPYASCSNGVPVGVSVAATSTSPVEVKLCLASNCGAESDVLRVRIEPPTKLSPPANAAACPPGPTTPSVTTTTNPPVPPPSPPAPPASTLVPAPKGRGF